MQKKMNMKTSHAAAATLAAALFFALALTGCGGGKKAAAAAKAKQDADNATAAVFAVSTTTASRGELKDYLEFSGDVAAKTNVDILPDAAGKITEVKVRVGDSISKDQVVALVDASRPGMTYENGPVKSPISGTITAVNVVAGSMVSQQSSVARVSKTELLEIGMNVPERYISKIKADQTAYLRFDAYPGEVFPARITEISPVLDQTSRSMAVKLSLVKQDARIKAGMFARVKLITDTKTNIVKIPAAAVVTRFGENFVFVVQPGGKQIVKKVPVTVGIIVDDKAEILSGLKTKEEVVVKGQTLLEDGSEVNIVSRAEPLPETENAK
jgi:multidrug efflux pump subunit AcrA (membrane-fusion protein)